MQAMTVFVLLALVAPTVGLFFDATPADRPISKVLKLMQDLTNTLQTEAKADEDINDKMQCWCAKAEAKKEEIANMLQQIQNLEARNAELNALRDGIIADIARLDSDLNKTTQQLDNATATRAEQLASFRTEEKDLLKSIGQVQQAITVLKKDQKAVQNDLFKNPIAAIELPPAEAAGLASAVSTHSSLLAAKLPAASLLMLKSLASEGNKAKVTPLDPYATTTAEPIITRESGPIFDILNQMKKTFEDTLNQTRSDENGNIKSFLDLKQSLNSQISSDKAQREADITQQADTEQKIAVASEDIRDIDKAIGADRAYVAKAETTCASHNADYKFRTETRAQEITAVQDAITLLSKDDSRDMFTVSFNPALIQLAESDRKKREPAYQTKAHKVAALLQSAARRLAGHSGAPMLAALAVQTKIDNFEKVKAAIETMQTNLAQQKADEITKKDYCVTSFHNNIMNTDDNNRTKISQEAHISDLENTISMLKDSNKNLNQGINELQVQIKKAGQAREKENLEFQVVISDQRQTQDLITKAISMLNNFYNKVHDQPTPAPQLLQLSSKAAPADPENRPDAPQALAAYNKAGGGAKVTLMLERIVADSRELEATATDGEKAAQKNYQELVNDSNAAIAAKQTEIMHNNDNLASSQTDLMSTSQGRNDTIATLAALAKTASDLHEECDWVTKNFEVRQMARDEENRVLQEAKAILSGMKINKSFLQRN